MGFAEPARRRELRGAGAGRHDRAGAAGATIHYCTVNLTNRLHQLNIPVTVDDRPDGTHSWGYWEDELHRSWPFLAQTIGSRVN